MPAPTNRAVPAARRLFRPLLALLLAAPAAMLTAQPSGGPYGPQPRTYEVPKDAPHVYYVAPDARADGSGAAPDQPMPLSSALERAVTGDAVILRGGTYRTGDLRVHQGFTLQPYADEEPVLMGTEVATEGVALRDNLWRVPWTHLFPAAPADWWRRDREGARTPLWLFNNDMVFVDGRPLKTVGWEGAVTADSFSVDYAHGQVYVGVDPKAHLVEITAHDGGLLRTTADLHGRPSDHRGFILRGLTFTQYAYRAIEVEGHEPEGPADESTYGKDVVGTTLEDVTLTHCSRVAGYFRGDRCTLRRCLVSDTSTEGVYLLASSDCLLEKNIFRRNNVEEITGYYPSAVKIFNQTHRVTCRDNLVLDQPHSNGIWYDVGNHDGVFVDNWIQDCVDGFFYEISQDAVVAGNVFVRCDKGIRVLNSARVRAYHNTLVDTVASFERTERSAVGDHFGWHPATGPDVEHREGHVFAGNLLVADPDFTKPLLRNEQTKVLCGRLTRTMMAQLGDNVYVRSGPAAAAPLLVWSPADGPDCTVALAAPADLTRLHPEFAAGDRVLNLAPTAVLQGPALQRYALIRPLPAAASVPAEIRQLLGWPAAPAAAGAYPGP